MAVHPRDLRPLHPHRPHVAGDLAEDGSPDDHPSTSSSAAGGGGRRVKLLCSYGGRIVPRPSDNALRYAGGDTRIISVRRDATLPEVMRKMSEACGGGGPVVMRYQLPDEDLDALVSVSTPEDLENMMEEYDKLALASPRDGPSVKLRVFLFPQNPADPSADPSSDHLESAYHHQQQQQQQQYYIEAVNGFDPIDPSCGNGISRLPSMASMVSSQNSDAAAADEGTSPANLSPTAAVAQDPSRLDLGGLTTPAAVLSDERAQILNPARPEVPPAAPYVPPVFIDPHFVNAQTLGMAGLPPVVNVVGVGPHSYVPAMHISMAHPASLASSGIPAMNNSVAPPTSQIGTGIPDTNIAMAPPATQIISGGIPIQTKLDPCLEKERYGAKGVQLSGDPVYKVVHQPVSQPPPLPPSFLYAQNGERNELHHMPKPSQGQQQMRREDCNLCQKALPHAHSDTLINEHENGPRTAIPEASPVLHGHHSEDILRMWAQSIGTGAPVDVAVEPQSESMVASGHSGNFGFTVAHEMSHDNERIVAPNGKNLDPAKVFIPLDLVGLPGNTQTSYGMFSHPQQQLPQTSALTQYPDQQDVISKPFVTNVNSSGSANLYEAGQLIQDTASALSFDYLKPVDGMMKALHVSPSETSGLNVQRKPAVDMKNAAFVAESSQPARPQVGSNAMLPNYAYINSGIVPEGNTALAIDLLPSTSGIFTGLSSVQPENTSGIARFHPEELLSDITVSLGGNAQRPSSTTTSHTRNVVQMQQPAPSDSLFYNEDPRKITENAQLLPPRPSRVPSKESIKDFSKENLSVNGKGSDRAIQVEEGDFNLQSDYLNKDLGVEAHRPMKGDECVKQDLEALAEGVVASVLQSSEPPVPAFLARERKESDPCSNKDVGTTETNLDIDGEKTEVMKSRQSDKMNFGLPLAEDIGRLQIIKNSDLEELQELGSGTFGTVYHGKWRGSDVAIKRINERCFVGKSSEQERMRSDFWNEACKLADLHHPNVVAFYGVVLDGPGGSIATVTEFMVNGSLRTALQKSDKPPDRRKRLLIAMDVAFGMEYLHSRNIVHFDLKSDNLLVNLRDPQRPICKVGDLGLSKVKCQTLISGGVRGTLPWMAPELLNGSSSLVSEKVDVFSFGIVMWELLTTEEPYADLHYGAIIGGIVSNTLRPPVPESCDPEWRSLMEQCWSADPSKRPSFTEIAARLRAMAGSLPKKDHSPMHRND